MSPICHPGSNSAKAWRHADGRIIRAEEKPRRFHPVLKTGERLGIPIELALVDAECDLYDTDQMIRPASERSRRNAGTDAR